MNKNKYTIKGNILTDSRFRQGKLRIENDRITAIGDIDTQGVLLDMKDSYILPGFIDLHIHGIHLFRADQGAKGLSEMCRILPRYGVTGFLPTISPRPEGEDIVLLKELSSVRPEGSEILGFHLEGPFLKLLGSLNTEANSKISLKRAESLIQASKPTRTIFSISPDLEGIETLIPVLAENRNPVFITHTAATVKQTQQAIRLGAKHATHFYDVFPCPQTEEPGVRPCGAVEAILADPTVSVDFILDGIHVDPVAVKMALAAKSGGPGSVCLITDSNLGAGMEPGRYVFGGNREIEFAFRGAPARLVKDQTIAGSGLTMDQALRNAVLFLGLELSQAIRLVSSNPAGVLGLNSRKGYLLPGYDADIVILDQNLQVQQTWISGKCCYDNQSDHIQ